MINLACFSLDELTLRILIMAARKTATKKPARKSTARKTTRKAPAKRATKRTPAKKTTARKSTTKKAATKRKTTASKTTARKSTVKKAATKRKTTARKTVAKKKPSVPKRVVAIKKAMTKSELLNAIANDVELTRKQVAAVLESLNHKVHCHLKGVGEFTVPGLLKIRVMRKPATKARKGINPFNGEETVFKAKPARNIPKFRALKALKEMAAK